MLLSRILLPNGSDIPGFPVSQSKQRKNIRLKLRMINNLSDQLFEITKFLDPALIIITEKKYDNRFSFLYSFEPIE